MAANRWQLPWHLVLGAVGLLSLSLLVPDPGFLWLKRLVIATACGLLLAVLWSMQRADRRLARLARADAVTGLRNRQAFNELLPEALRSARRSGRSLAVILVDLDHFKDVNDSFGHHFGDQVLCHLAELLVSTMRSEDYVFRYGGDEFGLILPRIRSPTDAMDLAKRVLAAFEPPFHIAGREVSVSCSVGVSTFPNDGNAAAELLRNADTALYRAKRERGPSFQVFGSSMKELADLRAECERDLAGALDRHQLDLHFQPQVRLRDGTLVGIEVFARWDHPQKGPIPPETFIPVAEMTGQMPLVGGWVIEQACRQHGEWQRTGLCAPPISVNLSLRQIQAGNLVDVVLRALEASGLGAESLRLEVSERDVALPMDRVVRCLDELGRKGIKLSMDDFGTGYASLTSLLRYPISSLKIDGSFIAGIPQSTESSTIVRTAITLARGLGLEVIAEGVETEEQLAFLQENGCHFGQGYLFGEPLPAPTFRAVLERRRVSLPRA